MVVDGCVCGVWLVNEMIEVCLVVLVVGYLVCDVIGWLYEVGVVLLVKFFVVGVCVEYL